MDFYFLPPKKIVASKTSSVRVYSVNPAKLDQLVRRGTLDAMLRRFDKRDKNHDGVLQPEEQPFQIQGPECVIL
eukprot:g29755.t1